MARNTLLAAIFLVVALAAQGESQAAPTYVLTDLGLIRTAAYNPILDFRDVSRPTDINNAGQVVGWSSHRLDCCNVTESAFLWSADTGIDPMAPAEAGRRHSANAINEAGTVVGTYGTPSGVRSVLWDASGAHDLGAGEAVDINDGGQILFRDGRIRSNGLTTTVTGLNVTTKLNNSGQVLGSITGDDSHGFLWDNATLTAIGDPAWRDSWVSDLSDTGYVVGDFAYSYRWECTCDFGDYTYREVIDEVHAFSYRAGTWTDLGAGHAVAVNNRGETVGMTANWDPAYFDPVLGAVPLRNLVQGTGTIWERSGIFGINDRGQIIGYRPVGINGEYHAFVLTPVPVPAAAWLLGSAVAALGALRRRSAR